MKFNSLVTIAYILVKRKILSNFIDYPSTLIVGFSIIYTKSKKCVNINKADLTQWLMP